MNMLFKSVILATGLVLSSVFLAGCSSEEEVPQETSEQLLYDSIQGNIKTENFSMAVRNLQLLESRYPFGPYAEQAQLEIIYAHYRNYEPDAAVAAADRFIRLHPQHRNADYAYYMKGLSSFTEGSGLFERFLPSDLTQRDPGAARQSFAHFSQLLARYPSSQYAADARKRMIYLRNLLARYEIHVANYYIKRGAFVAAANRGRYVVENFQQSPAVPDALAVMIQSYNALDMSELSANALATLKANYADHPALRDGQFNDDYAYRQEDRGIISYLTFGLFDKKDAPGFDSRAQYNPEHFEDDTLLSPEPQVQVSASRSWLSRLSFGLLD